MTHTYVPIRVYANAFCFERLIFTFLQTGTYGCSFRDGLKWVFRAIIAVQRPRIYRGKVAKIYENAALSKCYFIKVG